MIWNAQHLAVGAAIAIGLLIGIERGWNLRDAREGTRVAGVRTFVLLGLLGGLAGLLGTDEQPLVAALLIAAPALILAIGYATDPAKRLKPDATTAIAALLTLALGFVAGHGQPMLAIACAALVTFVLALRTEAHALIAKLDGQDIKAMARFAVIAAAVLPFLPSGDYGPYDAWNPQKLWLVVVLVTGFSFAGYVANRIFGARHGTIATALIGGAYSSTAVTQSLAQRLGSDSPGGAESAGIALASAVMYLRVLILVAALATSVLAPFAIVLLPASLAALIAGVWLYRKASAGDDATPPGNPIALAPALGFLLFVALAAVAARWAEGRFGEQGIATLVLVMGSLDVDAAIVTVGGLQPGAISPELAALALGGTVLANMTVKLGITIAYARSRGRDAAIALGASMIVLLLSLGVGFARLGST
ncbi:MgtC/SapB family protein [Sphingomonas qomolangmaensis]|uniref:DUF4010 domain-containing protein n=1 Tax=Sphingomonas qomolangmaensis TaxID=2918765 RepID=A0ABY5LBT3_9SPHN|nr:DUF4010 domain-containing protein [Sphingomonas qomolangmaensis]UUL83254.1 DUF4010 domain-containing protein [Sphingomonas qomolangmaensis]